MRRLLAPRAAAGRVFARGRRRVGGPGAGRRARGRTPPLVVASPTATRSACASAARRRRCGSSASTRRRRRSRTRPVQCFGPEAIEVHHVAAAHGHTPSTWNATCEARDDYGRLLGVRVPRRRRLVREPRRSSARATPDRSRSRRTSPTRRLRAPPHAPRSTPISACGPRAPDSVPRRDDPRRTPRPLPPTPRSSSSPATTSAAATRPTTACSTRCATAWPPARQLMVPAPWARARGDALPSRPTTSACTSRSTASTTPTGSGRSPTPRRCCRGEGGFPRDRRRPVGARRPGRGAARVPRPDRTGAWRGASTSPTSRRTSRPSRCGPSSSTSTSSWRSSSACRSACRPRSPPSRPASRSAVSPPRRASCSPTTSTTTGAPAAASASTTRSATCSPASPRSTCSRSIDTPEVRAITAAARAWIDDHELVTADATLRTLLAESGATPIGYRTLRDAMRAG